MECPAQLRRLLGLQGDTLLREPADALAPRLLAQLQPGPLTGGVRPDEDQALGLASPLDCGEDRFLRSGV